MSTIADIDQLLTDAVNASVAPGITAIAADSEDVFYRGAAGTRGDAPMGPDSVLWIASMTKLATTLGALEQVELGKLSLDDPISLILPELADKQIIEGFDAEGVEILRPAKEQLTLRHLLTHTSGFAYDFWNADVTRYEARHGVPGILACENSTLANPSVADPGSSFVYGISTDWVGKAIERVSGLDLEHYLEQNIFAPLGLSDSGVLHRQPPRAACGGERARRGWRQHTDRSRSAAGAGLLHGRRRALQHS